MNAFLILALVLGFNGNAAAPQRAPADDADLAAIEKVVRVDLWMDPRFKATSVDIRELRIDRSRSGEVAWWSCILDDLGEFGFDDIDFESEEFSRKYHVKAEDRKLAYDVFHPKMIEFFLGLGDFKLTTARSLALFRRGSGTMSIEQIEKTLFDADGFLDRLPRYLRKDRHA